MRSLLLNIILCSYCFNINGQVDSVSYIIENAIRSRSGVTKIVYIDTPIDFYHTISNFVDKGLVKGNKDTSKVVLRLTKAEIEYLNKQFKKNQNAIWQNGMFDNSLLISNDSLITYLKKRQQQKGLSSDYPKKYFYFNKPTYFRKGSFAIFRLAEMYDHSSGNDLLYIYEKKQNEWRLYMFINSGAW